MCTLLAEILTFLLDLATVSSSVRKTASDYANVHVALGFYTNISQGSVATCMKCGEVCNIQLLFIFLV